MTLTEFIADIDKKDKKRTMPSLLAVVYENYRVIGLTKEVGEAIERYKDSNGVDLSKEKVSYNVIASAYGNIPQTYLAYIEKVADTASSDATTSTETVSE